MTDDAPLRFESLTAGCNATVDLEIPPLNVPFQMGCPECEETHAFGEQSLIEFVPMATDCDATVELAKRPLHVPFLMGCLECDEGHRFVERNSQRHKAAPDAGGVGR